MSEEKTAVDVLRDARALIEKGWTQREFARTADGRGTEWEDPSAVCWCTFGAIYRAQCLAIRTHAVDLMSDAIDTRITLWNDAPERTQAEVLAAFDTAIELAQSEQPA